MSDRWEALLGLRDELGLSARPGSLGEVAKALGVGTTAEIRDDKALDRLLVAIRLLLTSGVVDEEFPGLAGLTGNNRGLAAAESATRRLLAGESLSAVYPELVGEAGPEATLTLLSVLANMVPGGGLLMRYLKNGLKKRRGVNRQASSNLGAIQLALQEQMTELGMAWA